jgi:hypothetical protein
VGCLDGIELLGMLELGKELGVLLEGMLLDGTEVGVAVR